MITTLQPPRCVARCGLGIAIKVVNILYKLAHSRCFDAYSHTDPMLYIERIHLPQAILSLRCDGSIGQSYPELAAVALLFDFV